MEQLSYKLDVFEGPLDLLLHLITKHKLDIYDIPIYELVSQYLDFIKNSQEENLEIAGDFLEMAARLVYIKTLSLLPSEAEETEELKKELTGELIEYRDCKKIAEMLSTQTVGFDRMIKKPSKMSFPDLPYERIHESFEIYKAYLSAVGKKLRKLPPPASAFAGIVRHKIVSVNSRIVGILAVLVKGKKERFMMLFENADSRSELVATFLAVLELCKAKRLVVDGDGDECEIELISDEGGVEELEFE